MSGASATDEQREGLAVFDRFRKGDVAIPIVGAINATAVAGGFELMMGCDIVVAASHARFGLPEVKRGVFAAGGGIVIGSRIPLAAALELALTGDYIDAERAYELGLVNRVVDQDAVLDEALAIAERIAKNGPLALQATKELIRLAVTDAPAAWAKQEEWQAKVFASEDAKEGAISFMEKRDPVWQGR